jgi:RNA polymerase-binding transcription factor DksA
MISEHQIELYEAEAATRHSANIADIQNRLKSSGATVCLFCNEPIELERLAALPSAKSCIDCMEQLETL